MAKPRKIPPRTLQKKGSAKYLEIEETHFLRPNWSTIVEHMVKTRQDILLKLLYAGGDVGLYKALRRAGYWAHTHRISETKVVYRLSEKPPLEQEGDLQIPKNPLPRCRTSGMDGTESSRRNSRPARSSWSITRRKPLSFVQRCVVSTR